MSSFLLLSSISIFSNLFEPLEMNLESLLPPAKTCVLGGYNWHANHILPPAVETGDVTQDGGNTVSGSQSQTNKKRSSQIFFLTWKIVIMKNSSFCQQFSILRKGVQNILAHLSFLICIHLQAKISMGFRITMMSSCVLSLWTKGEEIPSLEVNTAEN